MLGDLKRAASSGDVRALARLARFLRTRQDLAHEKLVSKTHRFVWICNPKAASRATKATLRAMDPTTLILHESAARVIAAHPESAAYFTFAFVRHPYERALSFHSELRSAHLRYTDPSHVEQKNRKRRILFARYPGLAEAATFHDYCRWLHTPYAADQRADRHFLSQNVLLRRHDGSLPDFLGTLENFAADFQRVLEHLRLPAREAPVLNTTLDHVATSEALARARRERAGGELTEDCKALLAERYRADFPLGGYQP